MKIIFSSEAEKQITKLDKPIQKRIVEYLAEVSKLDNPKTRGKALVGNLAGLWRYRACDYRILCKIKDSELIIFVVEVGHRKEIYDIN